MKRLLGLPAGRRRPAVSGVELGLGAAVVLVTLLYSRAFDDNLLAKGGVLLLLAGGLLAASVVRAVADRGWYLPRLPVYLPFAAWTLWALLSVAASPNRGLGLEALLLHAAPVILFIVLIHLGRRPAVVVRLLATVVLASIVVSVIGLLQFVGIDPLAGVDAELRLPSSTLGNTNFVAYYNGLVLPLLAALLLCHRRCLPGRWRAVLALALALAAALVLVAGSRAGWLSVGVALVLLLLLLRGRRLQTRGALGLVLGVVLALPVVLSLLRSVPLGPSDQSLYTATEAAGRRTWERALTVLDPDDFSRQMRVRIWSDTFAMIPDTPVLGVAPGSTWASVLPYIDRNAWNRLLTLRTEVPHEPRHAENEYLEFAVETGLVGLGLLLWLLAALLWLGFGYLRALPGGARRSRTGPRRAVTAGLLCGLVAVLVHSLAGFPLHHPVVTVHLWLLAGTMVALHTRKLAAPGLAAVPLAAPVWRFGVGLAGGALALLLAAAGLRILVADHAYQQANDRLVQGDVPSAMRTLDRAARWRGHDFQYFRLLGRLALGASHPAEARVALERSVELHPNDAGALRLLGGLQLEAGDPQARQTLTRAVAGDRSNGQSYALLAQAHRQAGDSDAAISLLRQALTRAPHDPELLSGLALALRERGDLVECLALLELAVQHAPQDGRAAGNLGAVYLQTGASAKAEAALRRALVLDPDRRTEWLANLAQALLAQGKTAAARQAAAVSLTRAPSDPVLQQLHRTVVKAGEGKAE